MLSKQTIKKKDEVLVGIDYGTKNIGVALGINGLVMPVTVISNKDARTAIREVARIALENNAEKFVVGLPVTEEGKETRMSIEIRKFGKLLKIICKKPVAYYSEHSSSIEAHANKAIFGYSTSKKMLDDHIAAALTLKRYFDER